MKVVIRVDASIEMGAGHVMRCLTLANALREKGAEVQFICRKHTGNLIDYIHSNNYFVHILALSNTTDSISSKEVNGKKVELLHASWIGATQEYDAQECKLILKDIKPDWLIVDHYSIDATWQTELNSFYGKLMVIDDLADRYHQCDLLLDQTYGRRVKEYQSLVTEKCQMLLGSKYALLRPEFEQWREFSLKRRAQPQFKKLLVTMGGVDPDNATSRVLDALKTCNLPRELEIVVVMGAAAPHIGAIKEQAEEMPYKTRVKASVDNMAEIMANADLAIGAAGSTTWERGCLGLPSIQVVIADNQMEIANRLDSIRAIKYLKEFSQLCESIKWLRHSIQKTSLVASSIIDGQGVSRVLNYINFTGQDDCSVSLEPAVSTDSNFVYELQTKEVRQFFRNLTTPSLDEHIDWFNRTINSHESQLFIVTFNNQKAGVLRIDDLNTKELEISIIVSPEHAGQGVAKKAINKLEDMMFGKKLKAIIHKDNIASRKLFEKLEFEIKQQDGGFVEYFKNV